MSLPRLALPPHRILGPLRERAKDLEGYVRTSFDYRPRRDAYPGDAWVRYRRALRASVVAMAAELRAIRFTIAALS